MKLKGRRQSKNVDDTTKKQTFAKAAKTATDNRVGRRHDEVMDEVSKYQDAIRAMPRKADNKLHGYDVDQSISRAAARLKNKGKVKR